MALYDDYKDKLFVPSDQSWTQIGFIHGLDKMDTWTGFKLPLQQNERSSLFISGNGGPMLYFPFHYVVYHSVTGDRQSTVLWVNRPQLQHFPHSLQVHIYNFVTHFLRYLNSSINNIFYHFANIPRKNEHNKKKQNNLNKNYTQQQYVVQSYNVLQHQ